MAPADEPDQAQSTPPAFLADPTWEILERLTTEGMSVEALITEMERIGYKLDNVSRHFLEFSGPDDRFATVDREAFISRRNSETIEGMAEPESIERLQRQFIGMKPASEIGEYLREYANDCETIDELEGFERDLPGLLSDLDPVEALRAEALGRIAISIAELDIIKGQVDQNVRKARELRVSWADIGRAAGIASQSAMRRWDAAARERHSEYQRRYYPSREND